MLRVTVFILISLFFINGCTTSNQVKPSEIQELDTPKIKAQKSMQMIENSKINNDYSENKIDLRREKIIAKIIKLEKKMLLKKRIRYSQTIDSLMWQDNPETTSIKRSWYDARDYCKNSLFLDYSNWYLPSSKQLITLYKNKHRLNYKDTSTYWSSTWTKGKTFSWHVSFDSLLIGTSRNYDQRKYKHKVRCVRTVQ